MFEATLSPRDPAGPLRMLLAAAVTLLLVGLVSVVTLVVWVARWLLLLLWSVLWPPITSSPMLALTAPIDLVELEPLEEQQLQLAEDALYKVQVPTAPSEEQGAEPADQLVFRDSGERQIARSVGLLSSIGTIGGSNDSAFLAMLGGNSAEINVMDAEWTADADLGLGRSLGRGDSGLAIGGLIGARREVGSGGAVGRGTGAGVGTGPSSDRQDEGELRIVGGVTAEVEPLRTITGSSSKASTTKKCLVDVRKFSRTGARVMEVSGCPKRLHKDASRVARTILDDLSAGWHTIEVTLVPE